MNLKLDPLTNDLIITDRAPVRIEGREYIAQLVGNRLRTLEGEWVVDKSVGIPWLTGLLEKQTPLEYLELLITHVIETTAGVMSVEKVTVSVDRASRKLTYTFVARSVYGQIEGGS